MSGKPGLLMFYPYMEYMAGDAAEHFDLLKAWEEQDLDKALDEKGENVVAILTIGQDYPINDALFDRLPNLQLIVAVGAGYASGQPAASVPLHWTADGLPVGIHLAARFGADEELIALCAELEAARPWIGRRPDLHA